MYQCELTIVDEDNVFIGECIEKGETVEEAKEKATSLCKNFCEDVPVAYVDYTITDADGNYMDGDEFTLRNGELDLSGGSPVVGMSLVELWEHLKGGKTADGAEIVVTPDSASSWDGSWPAPSDAASEEAFFDLKKNGETLCCDGEKCSFHFDHEKEIYVCRSENSDKEFLLTKVEFDIGTFKLMEF